MKELLHKIASISMALLVLFSSFSFAVHTHICGNEVVDVSYIVAADSCSMEMNIDNCSTTNSSEQQLEKEPCCKDITEIIEGNQNEQQAIQSLEIQQVQFIVAFVDSYRSLFENLDTESTFFNKYAPPLVVKDIQVLYDTFII